MKPKEKGIQVNTPLCHSIGVRMRCDTTTYDLVGTHNFSPRPHPFVKKPTISPPAYYYIIFNFRGSSGNWWTDFLCVRRVQTSIGTKDANPWPTFILYINIQPNQWAPSPHLFLRTTFCSTCACYGVVVVVSRAFELARVIPHHNTEEWWQRSKLQ